MDSKKVAFITGANKGIGLEIARQLGKQGFTVVVGSRDASRGESAAATLKGEGFDASSVKLDVESQADIDALPGFFESNSGRLDVLVNNAGTLFENDSPEDFRRTFEINTIAPHFIALKLLPLLKASPEGRIVNQSSVLGSLQVISGNTVGGDWLKPAYSASKAALNMLTVMLAIQLNGTNVKVNAAHPGWVKTDLGGDGAQLEVEEGAGTAVWLATLPSDGPTGGYFHKQERLPW